MSIKAAPPTTGGARKYCRTPRAPARSIPNLPRELLRYPASPTTIEAVHALVTLPPACDYLCGMCTGGLVVSGTVYRRTCCCP
ncbi:hypothetical protein [Mycolicibacterium sp. HS_4_1]